MITFLAMVVQVCLCAGAYWLLHTFPTVPVLGAAWKYIMYAVMLYSALSFIALIINSIHESSLLNSFTNKMVLKTLSFFILAVSFIALTCMIVGTNLLSNIYLKNLLLAFSAFSVLIMAVLGIVFKDKMMNG